MTVKLKSLTVDVKKEAEGDWVPYLPWKGVRFKVRSTESPEFKAAQDKLLREFAKRRQQSGQDVPDLEIQTRLGQLFAEHILIDWEGLDEAYTPTLAEQVLTEPEYREVFRAITDCASRVGRSEIEFLEIEAKN